MLFIVRLISTTAFVVSTIQVSKLVPNNQDFFDDSILAHAEIVKERMTQGVCRTNQ